MSADASQASPPPFLGRYRVLRTIARGGMSLVYEVEEPTRRARFALKHLTVDTDLARARFRREYQAMVHLIHPNIGRVFAFDDSGDQPWMTLEYLDGRAVGPYIDGVGSPGSAERTHATVTCMHALACALEHVHGRDIVHRDIKSGNVLVLPDGRVKLVDFGIAFIPGSNQEDEAEEFVGTLAYAAPEQFRGDRPTPAADLYGVGCLMYRLLTGQRPFTGANATEMARLHTSKAPRRPRSLVPEIPAELERIVLRLLKKQPSARIPSASALAVQLEEWLDTQPQRPLSVALDRGSRRGIGREDAIEAVARTLSTAPAGTLITLRGLPGARHGDLLELVIADAVARQVPTTRVSHTTPERFTLLQAAGDTRQRAVVAVEELHAWDSGSLRALDRSLDASRAHGVGAVFVATVALQVRDLTLDALIERAERDIVLTPLSLHDTRRLIGALLQRPPPPAACTQAVHAATDGVPAYVEEVVAGFIDEGALDGVQSGAPIVSWPLRTGSEVAVPEAAAWAVDTALSGLDDDGRRLVEALAATRSPSALDELASLAGVTLSRRAATVDRLRSSGLVHLEDDGTALAWTRAVSARLIRERTPGPRARTMARRALSSRTAWAPADHVRLALAAKRIESALIPAHVEARRLLAAGRPASALQLVEPVVAELDDIEGMERDQALILLACTRALCPLRPSDPRIPRFLTQVQELTSSPALLAESNLVTAQVHEALARNADARHKLGEAWTHSQKAADPDLASRIAHQAGSAYLHAGHVSWAGRWFERCRRAASVPTASAAQARSHAGTALMHLHHGQLDDALAEARTALEHLSPHMEPEVLSTLTQVQVTTLRLQGRYSETIQWLREHGALLEASEVPHLAVATHLARAEVELDLGRLGWAQDAVEQALSGMTGRDHTHQQLRIAILQARIHLRAGLVGLALESLPQLVHRARRAGILRLARQAATTLAGAHAHNGDPMKARELMDSALSEATGTGDALGLIDMRRDELRSLSTLFPPADVVTALSGWPGLERAYAVQLNMHRARWRWARSQLQDTRAAQQDALTVAQTLRNQLEPAERVAFDLSVADLA